MIFSKRIDKTFLYSLIVMAVALIGVLGALFIGNLYTEFEKNAEKQRTQYIDSQKALVQNEVEKVIDYIGYMKSLTENRLREDIRERTEEAYSIAINIYNENKNSKSPSEIEKSIKDALRPIRFNHGRGYYFACDFDGIEQLFADRPELEGENLIEMRDGKGNFVIKAMIEIAKNRKEGFYSYYWTKPGTEGREFPKIAYVKHLEPFDWFLGTGEYLDDVEGDIKREILERIGEIRFGDEGYIFVVDFDGVTLMNDIQKELIGKNLWEMTDPNGVKVIQEERKAVENPAGGFIHYVWNKPSEARPTPKISFMKGVREWQWMVGAGVYVDEIDKVIQDKKRVLEKEVRSLILKIVAVFGALLLIFFAMARWISIRMKKSFDAFSAFFQRSATESTKIDVSSFYYSEFKELASAANRMIGKREQAETALRQSERQKKEMESQLKQTQKMESIGTLAGGIAHDFNNILCPIVGMSELLMEDFPCGSPEHEKAEEIHRAGLRGSELVKQILTISRKSEQKSVVLSLQTLLKETLKLMRATIPSNIEIVQEIQSDCGRVTGDPTQLQQIVMNLMTNAFHAVEQSGGRIGVRLEEMVLGEEGMGGASLRRGRYAVITVSDTGYGIDSSIMDKIFEPYFTTKPQGKGTGLGLAVVYGIIQEHRGDIRVESAPGKGAVFDVILPVTNEEPEEKSHDEEPIVSKDNERILLVDDEEALVQMGVQMLERLGYRVIPHVRSLDALAAFEADPGGFDLVVSDMTMPSMTGGQLAKRIRDVRKDIPIIICTGFSEGAGREMASSLGIDAILMKPMTMSEMARIIRKVLDESQRRNDGARHNGEPSS